jgi:hypothetical protein
MPRKKIINYYKVDGGVILLFLERVFSVAIHYPQSLPVVMVARGGIDPLTQDFQPLPD